MGFMCLVCGFPDLTEEPRGEQTGGSYEICPSCGFQFGYDDEDQGISYEDWRHRWIEQGSCWKSKGVKMPENWDSEKQLQNLEGDIRKNNG